MTQASVRHWFNYDPATGILSWRNKPNSRIVPGRAVTMVDTDGYTVVRFVDGRRKKAHRIIWLYLYGWVPASIDHANGDRGDNRLANLRPATDSENRANCKKHQPRSLTTPTSDLKGVFFNGKRWRARIGYRRKKFNLGTYDTEEEAHAAYMKAAKAFYGQFSTDGVKRA